MSALLLEVGCEELPAVFVEKAFNDLHASLAAALGEAFGGSFSGQALGTPRRLIVAFDGVPARQEDAIKEVRGPALKTAYDEAGNPTGALLGFCRSNEAEPSQLRKDEQYVWFDKPIPGRPAAEVLGELLPKAIKGLSFEKSMRWGSARLRFARPIRWLLAAFDGEVVPFEIEGVQAGLMSRGHRFYAPEEFEARTFDQLIDGLRKHKVEPDPNIRRQMILDQAVPGEGRGEGDLVPELPDALVDENVFLTEWPTVVVGEFREEHLELPEPVLTTAMAKHERMFPVRDREGKLTRKFIFVRNSGEDATVRRGAEWVLNARLDDAQFFYREDIKHDLEYFLEKTSGIVFQEKLGTVRERADRLEKLAGEFARQVITVSQRLEDPQHRLVSFAKEAGRFAKADLSTGLVSDMASLQGIVGGEYASRPIASGPYRSQVGIPDVARYAIGAQYDHTKILGATDEGGRVAAYVIVADHLDKLAGYLGLGMNPSGSSDPYGLRRSTQILVEIALEWPFEVLWDYQRWLEEAIKEYKKQRPGLDLDSERAEAHLADLLRSRYSHHFSNVRYDVLEAATWDEFLFVPRTIANRIEALTVLAADQAFVQTAVRPINIVEAEKRKGWAPGAPDVGGAGGVFISSARSAGFAAKSQVAERLAAAHDDFSLRVGRGKVDVASGQAIADEFRRMAPIINEFLDTEMVNYDENPDIRHGRLRVLDLVAWDLKLFAGDFSKIVIEG